MKKLLRGNAAISTHRKSRWKNNLRIGKKEARQEPQKRHWRVFVLVVGLLPYRRSIGFKWVL